MIEYPPAGVEGPGTQFVPASTHGAGKSFVVTWLLALLLGMVGADRFYLGKVGTGLLKLVTCGGAGLWALVDLVLVLTGAQRDKQGRPLAGFRERRTMAWGVTAAILTLGLVTGACSAALNGTEPPGSAVADETDNAAGTPAEEEAEPKAEPEAEPEAEPKAEPAADAAGWAEETFGSFEPVQESGTGDSVVRLPEGATAGLVTARHEGSRNFALSVLDEANQPTGDLLVNTIGRYAGTTIYGLHDLGGDGVRVEVTADGPWQLHIEPVAAAPAVEESGSGDAVFLYGGGAGALTITHDGERNFAVIEETGAMFSMGLLVTEIGRYEGTVPLSGGPSVISVTADGSWTMQAQ